MNAKAEKIIALAKGEVGSPYVFGAVGEECTPTARGRRQRSDHPTIRSACQVLSGKDTTCFGCKFEGRRMYDCRGFTYWLMKQVGISISSVGATTQWRRASSWAAKGEINTLPDLVCCVFVKSGSKMIHTGMHIGGGVVIDCSTGVTVKSTKGFTHWAVPVGLYTDEEIAEAEVVRLTTYRKGMSGAGVSGLQALLTQAGYPCEPTGTYDEITIAQVKSFQRAHRLTVDGVAGPLTQARLKEVLAAELPEEPEEPETASPMPTATEAEDGMIEISLDGLTVSLDKAQARELYNRLSARLGVRA